MNSVERKQKKLEKAKKRAKIKAAKKAANRRRWKRRFGRMGSFIGRLFSGVNNLIDRLGIRSKIQASILAQILLNFFIALTVGVMVTVISLRLSVEIREDVETTYDRGYDEIFRQSERLFEDVMEAESIDDFFGIMEESNFFSSFMSEPEIYITDTTGNVLFKNDKATAEKLNIIDVAEKAGDVNLHDSYSSREPQEVFRVFKIDGQNGPEKLMIYISSPREYTIYTSEIVGNGGIFPYINGLVAFIFTFILLSRKKLKMVTEISDAMLFIADGDLDYEVEEDGSDEVALLAENINFMRRALKQEKEEQLRIEKTKSELITNVSHDLRTPLTSIMGYLGLIRTEQFKTHEDMLEYAEIAYAKSEKLKILIDDLFEYTKYANTDIELHLSMISMNQLVQQIISEYTPVLEDENLDIDLHLPEEDIFVEVDPKRIVRVCENLLMNAVKYAYKPSSIDIRLIADKDEKEGFCLIFENDCDIMDDRDLDNLFERLYKADKSRSENGSGLGLAITKGIVDAHGGEVFAKQDGHRVKIGFKI
ncbi:ATP-binding protein [Fusibacter sp. JL216-2]|uniref:sensor histidine kinase n=1 Tax=Fusibacter sp. JL216-2 TaxID=3071453 RepID=UPI003D329F3A